MRKWNTRFYRDKFFWLGILCIVLAFISFSYFNQPVHSTTKMNTTESTDSSEFGDHVNEKIGSISELRQAFEAIQVGQEETGTGGSTKKQVNSLLGPPNMKSENYFEDEKQLTYTWHQFSWETPLPMLSISYAHDKVVNKTLYFSNEETEDQLFDQEAFDALQLEEAYTREDLIENFGYPDMESVDHYEIGMYEYYTWFRSDGIYELILKDNHLVDKRKDDK